MRIHKLEALRGFAAIYVMASHLSSNALHMQKSWLGQPFRFGQEGVLLFFLLSGFVIYYSWHESSGPKNFKTFFYKRFRRIYPIFILALILSYAVVSEHWGPQPLTSHLGTLFGNLFMVQGFGTDPGFKVFAFMGDAPLWSLSYEWWFYMMFYPLLHFVPAASQKFTVLFLALAGIAGDFVLPNIFFHILALFPIWWCGLEFAREYVRSGTFTIRTQLGMIGIMVVMAIAYGGVVGLWVHRGGELHPVDYPLVKLRAYVAGIGLIALFFAWKKSGFWGFAWTLGPFAIFADMSYAIYVFHYPIVCHLQLFPSPLLLWLNVGLKVTIVLVLAYLAEEIWQKQWVNPWMDRLFRRYLGGSRRPDSVNRSEPS